MSCWPVLRSKSKVGTWNDLLIGGKDGIFVVVMTLSWWIHKKKDKGSKLTEAMTDVSWVLSQLVSTLSTKTPEPHPSTPSRGRCLSPANVEPPPKKRARRVRYSDG